MRAPEKCFRAGLSNSHSKRSFDTDATSARVRLSVAGRMVHAPPDRVDVTEGGFRRRERIKSNLVGCSTRNVGGSRSAQDLVGESGGTPVELREIRSVGHVRTDQAYRGKAWMLAGTARGAKREACPYPSGKKPNEPRSVRRRSRAALAASACEPARRRAAAVRSIGSGAGGQPRRSRAPSPPPVLSRTMLRQFLVGGIVSLGNIAVHAMVMTLVVTVVRRVGRWERRESSLWLAAIMVATVAVLLVAHVAEVVLWSVTYGLVDAAPPEADLLYFALVNYTTLGYGDVLPVARWRLLGPITAMNGILLFGWSTAVIFEVMDRATHMRDCSGKTRG